MKCARYAPAIHEPVWSDPDFDRPFLGVACHKMQDTIMACLQIAPTHLSLGGKRRAWSLTISRPLSSFKAKTFPVLTAIDSTVLPRKLQSAGSQHACAVSNQGRPALIMLPAISTAQEGENINPSLATRKPPDYLDRYGKQQRETPTRLAIPMGTASKQHCFSLARDRQASRDSVTNVKLEDRLNLSELEIVKEAFEVGPQ